MSGSARAAVFDLDGTLVDSLADLTTALNRLLAEEARKPVTVSQARTMVGDGAAKLIERALAATGPMPGDTGRQVARFVEIYEAGLAVRSRPFPGARQALSTLKTTGYRLAVCTNKPRKATVDLLAALDLINLFDVVAGGDSFAAKKPDPAPLLGVLADLAIAPADAVMVGDHENDVRCARAAGVPVIAVSFGYSVVAAHQLGADRVIDSLAVLPQAIRSLAAPGA